MFQELAAFGRVGHARVNAPLVEFMSHIRSGGILLPVFIRVDDGRVFLTGTADMAGTLPAGTGDSRNRRKTGRSVAYCSWQVRFCRTGQVLKHMRKWRRASQHSSGFCSAIART